MFVLKFRETLFAIIYLLLNYLFLLRPTRFYLRQNLILVRIHRQKIHYNPIIDFYDIFLDWLQELLIIFLIRVI